MHLNFSKLQIADNLIFFQRKIATNSTPTSSTPKQQPTSSRKPSPSSPAPPSRWLSLCSPLTLSLTPQTPAPQHPRPRTSPNPCKNSLNSPRCSNPPNTRSSGKRSTQMICTPICTPTSLASRSWSVCASRLKSVVHSGRLRWVCWRVGWI